LCETAKTASKVHEFCCFQAHEMKTVFYRGKTGKNAMFGPVNKKIEADTKKFEADKNN